MSAITHIPQLRLQPFVKFYTITEATQEANYNILPGLSIVLGFQFKGSLSYIDNEKEHSLSKAGVTGLLNNYRTFKNQANTGSVLVTFTETGAAHFFKTPMHQLFNGSYSLDDFIPYSQQSIMVEKLSEANSNIQKIQLVEDFLITILEQNETDQLAAAAVAYIKEANGIVSITKLADHLNISQSRLEKRFRAAVGASPKKFSSIVRFRHIISQLPQAASLTSLAYQAGYFDQAHFIKDFKTFTGQTPQQFITK